ncbi:short transient receptor potential channel 4-like, partial [Anneissia japonica]|uniref:short transient receptor potential channel 4-like n=1 Tax=Anneissia japonica TaxID=1529436 RepID=UPI001425BA17
MTVTEEYFDAIATGDINKLEQLLKHSNSLGLDVNFTDSNGLNAYAVAINEGLEVLVKILLAYKVELKDALLFAVENQMSDVVEVICSSVRHLPLEERMPIVDCRCVSDIFPAYLTPIILASHNNDFKIVQILYDNTARVPDPENDSERLTAPSGTLERSTEMLSMYTALASEAYLSVSSINPIEFAFVLTLKLRDLSNCVEEFKNDFSRLAAQVDEYAGKLLGKARSTEE